MTIAPLHLSDFVLDPSSGVRVLPGDDATTSYRDGAEQYLFDALGTVRDRSVGSAEVAGLVHDWASQYHLTPYRSTIFDGLGLDRLGDARVLELGAGCGAITRWLGERGAEVHAIEGSVSRAEVARRRCEDLEEVELYAANYSGLAEHGTFDLVTLIGVLEYSHLYHPEHKDPTAAAAANLALAARALGDEGVLVLAIENRLGLRYLNGGREDHSGRVFEGVQGYPWPDTPVTFSRREMEQLLAGAGFDHVETLVPFPDYKLARGIINPARCADADHIHNWMLTPAPDRGPVRTSTLYNESLAVREFARAGLLADVANSHLFVAFRGDPAATCERLGLDLEWSARHYSLDRRPGMRKRITLADGIVACSGRPLDEDPAVVDEARAAMCTYGLRFEAADEPHVRGDLAVLRVLEALTAEGVGPRFEAEVKRYREWLIDAFGTGEGGAGLPMVRGEAFDVTWWNLVVDPATGEWHVIDREWRLELPVPADFILWRTLRYFFNVNLIQLPASVRVHNVPDLVRHGLTAAGATVSDELFAMFERTERAVLGAIAPGPLPTERSPELEALSRVTDAPRAFSVVAFLDELADDPQLLAGFAHHFTAADDATLLLLAPATEEADAGELAEQALVAAGIDDEAPDMLLLAIGGEEAEAAIVEQASALLSERDISGALSILPQVGRADVEELRPYAEAVWAAA